MNQTNPCFSFEQRIQQELSGPLQASDVKVLQVNLGLYCNQVCRHCHVEAGPKRKQEVMSAETLEALYDWARELKPERVDLTGGAPELHPRIREVLGSFLAMDFKVQLRTNLTALLEPEAEGMIPFLAGNGISLVASLPCYLESNVDGQRGSGVYQKSIEALKELNRVGYASKEGLSLDLVYNPAGPSLPPSQAGLEADYKKELWDRHQIRFDHLIAIANMPIGHFQEKLEKEERLEEYQSLLQENFNPATLEGLMCRHQIHVDWQGNLSDCDFNYALDLASRLDAPNIFEQDPRALEGRRVAIGEHCYGCTAGAGSSCGGELA